MSTPWGRYEVAALMSRLEAACPGECEGTGVVPVYMAQGDPGAGSGLQLADEEDPELIRRWLAQEQRVPSGNGWHFVFCPVCKEEFT